MNNRVDYTMGRSDSMMGRNGTIQMPIQHATYTEYRKKNWNLVKAG